MLKIKSANYLKDYRIEILYEDGLTGILDLSSHSQQGMFSGWQEEAYFKKFSIAEFGETLEWPNGEDISPESIYSQIAKVEPLKAFESMLADKEALINA